ncbi:MAG: DMT family transporter [Anaerolineae bacterium]|nr:DMT family transporter [Anaerolineae bacterium]
MSITAVALALLTVCIWSFLAYLGSSLSHLAPLLLTGIALCIGGLLSIFRVRSWKVPLGTLAVGVYGLFGYHFLLFTAFRHAPTVEVNLINYLWPLLIVLLSPLILKGYRLHLHHLLGAASGLCGAALIVTGGKLSLDIQQFFGYACAAAAALVWASYSLLTKRLPPFSTGSVGAFCFISGLLALAVFVVQERSLAAFLALTQRDWLFLVLIGVGPLGSAFFTWDAALKRGDPRIIGSLSYLTPLISTLILVVVGGRVLNWVSAVAMVLIIGGALVGSLDLWRKRGGGTGKG